MPKLFISYKRGTDGVEKLKRDLRAAKYALWFDRDDIHLGDPDWQAEIENGLRDTVDGVVLCLTPKACESGPIQFEVRKALEYNRRIFPIMLEELPSISAGLRQIGLPDSYHVESFTNKDTWDTQFQRLLNALYLHGLGVTRNDLRRQRGEHEHRLHQEYLRRLVERIGRVRLAEAINPDYADADGAELEKIYVPLPTKCAISVEVKDYRIVNWWIEERKAGSHRVRLEKFSGIPHVRPATPEGWTETTILESLLDGAQLRLDRTFAKAQSSAVSKSISADRFQVYPSFIPLNVHDVAAACPRLVVLGGAGSGKSVSLHHLALCLAGAQHDGWSRTVGLVDLGRWPHRALNLVYIRLADFIDKCFRDDVTRMPTADDIWNYIVREQLAGDLADYAASLRADLVDGDAVLLLDGLDEVPYPPGRGRLAQRQQQLRALAQSLSDTFGKARILVTSRPYAYEGWTLPDFASVEIGPFDNGQCQQLSENLFRAGSRGDKEAVEAHVNRFMEQLEAIQLELKDTPLFLTMMATVFAADEAHGLPARKGALYRRCALLLLDTWTKAKPGMPTLAELLGNATREDLLARIAALAYEVHEQYGGQPGTVDIPLDLLSIHIFRMQLDDPTVNAARLVSYLSENTGLLVSPGHSSDNPVFRFAHRTFQEYLAAVHFVKLCQQRNKPKHERHETYARVRELIESKPQLWRVPCLFVGDVLVDEGQPQKLWDILDALLPDDVPDTLDREDVRCRSVWLAARLVEDHKLYEDKSRLHRGIRDHLVDWLVRLVETAQALDAVERADCGRALGWLGDPRDGVGVKDGVPHIKWCDIPAGEFLMGSDKAVDPNAADNELPQQQVKTDAYRIAAYPVTYQQYAVFVTAGGYTERKYWTEAGWGWRGDKTQPEYAWNDPDWHIPNHSVVGVTWYEAVAFCRWLSEQLGFEVRLPTEAERERAARGDHGQIFPYQGESDASKGSYMESGIGPTCAVGLFPDGASPFHALDMSGKLEWCATKWRTSYAEEEDNELGVYSARVVRGGAWYDNISYARAASRYWLGPEYRNYEVGFRVVATPIRSEP